MSARFRYSMTRIPPIPVATVSAETPDGSRAVPMLTAHLDTAADRTVIPLALAQRLGLTPLRTLPAVAFGGTRYLLDEYELAIDIPGVCRLTVNAVAHPNEPFILLGRDILNTLRITLDGPTEEVEFH
jgi:predicted aspartyl protease